MKESPSASPVHEEAGTAGGPDDDAHRVARDESGHHQDVGRLEFVDPHSLVVLGGEDEDPVVDDRDLHLRGHVQERRGGDFRGRPGAGVDLGQVDLSVVDRSDEEVLVVAGNRDVPRAS